MRALLGWSLVSASIILGSLPALAQDKPKAEVMHWWTSGGESAAVKVFADQYNKFDHQAIVKQAQNWK